LSAPFALVRSLGGEGTGLTSSPDAHRRASVLRRTDVVDSHREVLRLLPWFAVFVGFLLAYAWIRRDWVWIVGDDQNLMMPAINLGRGLTPNIDFDNGYPGITFYLQRAIMLVVGDQPLSEHVYTAIQAALFALVAAWVLRRHIPAALTWILVFFVWTVSFRLNPTPNPGNMTQALTIVSFYWMDRFGSRLLLRDALIAGSLAGLAFLFKQPGIFLPVVFLIYTSYAYLAWADKPPSGRLRGLVVGANVTALVAYVLLYVGASVFGVLDDPVKRDAMVFSSVVFVGPWVAAVIGLLLIPGRSPGTGGPSWSLRVAARANVVFAAGFLIVNLIGFLAIYGSAERAAVALRMVFFDAPQLINGRDLKVMQPLLLWPTLAIAVLVILSPFAIRAVRVWPLQLAIFAAACAGCLYTALTYSDLQFTIAGTLLCVLMVAIFWIRRPTDRESWNRFFIFLGATCLLAYLAPHPKYHYSLGILAVTGWFMLGSAAPQRWPTVLNVVGFGVVLGIALLTLQWANRDAAAMYPYQLGVHGIRSFEEPKFMSATVAAASASSMEDWLRNRYDYFVYLAHAP
jgi:hypothetical protein